MDYKKQLAGFRPGNQREEKQKERALGAAGQYGDKLLRRESPALHITSSAVILNEALDEVLLAYHPVYQTYAWPGGHADGEGDLLSVAMKEAEEETGAAYLFPLSPEILSLDFLPVPAHARKGEAVPAHRHLSAAYGLIAPKDQFVCEEAGWVPLARLAGASDEEHMLPLYRRVISKMKKIVREEGKDLALCRIVLPLLRWYGASARELPWREDKDPYRVWVSEVMLQQTRVEAVKPYFNRFMDALPTVQNLAEAPRERLLKLWEGLGYYSRAANLQKAAKIVTEQHGGILPRDVKGLLALPGVGAYTAGAIASICFDAPTPAVDGNVLRVLSRLTAYEEDIASLRAKEHFTKKLADIYPRRRSGDFTQALMELGAMVCIPGGAPLCGECPLSRLCRAYREGKQEILPRKAKKKPRRKEDRTVFVLTFDGLVAVRKREENTLLGGLWEFPCVQGKLTGKQAMAQLEEWGLFPGRVGKLQGHTHVFTHVEWAMEAYEAVCGRAGGEFLWVTRERLVHEIALPSAYAPFAKVFLEGAAD